MISILKSLLILIPSELIDLFQLIYPYFLFVLFLKIILNIYRLTRTLFYYCQYKRYLKKRNWHFKEYEKNIIKIFKAAGINDSYKSVLEPAGYGKLRAMNVSVFNNLSAVVDDVPILVKGMFHKTIGVYKSRILESINPFFWFEFIIFLPRHILEYLNVNPKNVAIKIVQIIYWILSIINLFLRDEIISLFRNGT